MIVDGDADVVLADEFFEAGESLRGGVAGDDYGDAGAFGVIEFGANVGVFVFGERNDACGVELDFCCGIKAAIFDLGPGARLGLGQSDVIASYDWR